MTRAVASALPKRGRPPRLSREAILDAALELLERAPRESLTVARIAAEVDAVPGALYRHFASLDDVLDGVLARVLVATQRPRIRRQAAWQGQVHDWMSALRRALLRYPSVLGLIGRRGRTSPAWLDSVAVLIPILERAGLRGVALARTHLWLTETTVALIMQEAALALPDQLAGAHAALGEMSLEGRALLEPLLKRLEVTSVESMFEFAAQQAIAAIVARAEA